MENISKISSLNESKKPHNPKCHFCNICDGQGCIGEMPGMGGVFENANFIANCEAWNTYKTADKKLPLVRLAPITGAVENIGWCDEKSFYFELLLACKEAGILLSIGDGTPDEKLLYGINAVKKLKTKAAVFIKPYPQEVFFERIEWAEPVAEFLGIDIDSSNIVTMRNLVHLEKKTAAKLLEIKHRSKVPFVIKGVFTEDDVKMVAEVKPDVVAISNHGGRIETKRGSTADFLAKNFNTLKKYCGEVWVDGGLRTKQNLAAAKALGASTVMIGRPFITALLAERKIGVKKFAKKLLD